MKKLNIIPQLSIVADVILPGDSNLDMPSASKIDIDQYFMRHEISNIAVDFLKLLNTVSIEKFGLNFHEIEDRSEQLHLINLSKLKNVRLFSLFIEHLFRAYYTSPDVLMLIGAGNVPPFPQGNPMSSDDWGSLEVVYEREFEVTNKAQKFKRQCFSFLF